MNIRKHLRYLRYLARHKYFVFIAGRRVGGIPLHALIIHDWSKFLLCEWFPYVESFYGPYAKLSRKLKWMMSPQLVRNFDRAWLHHQHLNPHHWQHWILHEDSGGIQTLEMPERYAREMVADWMGAGRAITGRWEAKEWYEKNRVIIILHENTRKLVEGLLQ